MTVCEGTIELHTVRLDVAPDEVARSDSLLAADERERARRFVLPVHARRFAVCRAALRTTLARHLGGRPDELRFEYSRHGKPRLAGAHAACGLAFNVSHSDGLAVIAVTTGRELGVDVERRRPVENCLQLAEIAFSPLELEWLSAVRCDRSEAFLTCWTRKEAYVKACGEGLSRSLTDFSVSLQSGAAARMVRVEGDPAEASRWWLTGIDPAPGFIGALASRGEPASLVWRRP